MIKSWVGKDLDSWIFRRLPFFFSPPWTPNRISGLGAGIGLLGALFFLLETPGWAGIFIALGGFLDMVDGAVARKQGLESAFGAFLDSTLDRLVDGALFLALFWSYAASGQHWMAGVTALALLMAFLTSYIRARAEAVLCGEFTGGLCERGERLAILAVGALLHPWVKVVDPLEIAIWSLLVLGGITVLQRLQMAYRAMEEGDKAS